MRLILLITKTSFIRISFVRALLITAFLFSLSGATQAQWKQLGNALNFNVHCMYFFDSTHGVAGGVGSIYRYANGVWSAPQSEPSDNTSYFTSIRYWRGNLYATSGAPFVWISDDSGKNWRNTRTASNFAYDTYFVGDSLYSYQNGTFAALDSNICIRSNNNGSYPSYSTNGGRTWTTPSGVANVGGLGTYADTCRKMFFASGKTDSAFYSLDSGRHWKHCGPPIAWDIFGGADMSLYHQDSTGVWVSVDEGTSWQFIGGPKATSGDRQIFGFGTDGKYIIASTGGAVWMYNQVDKIQPDDPVTRGDTLENCPINRIPVYAHPFIKPWTLRIAMVSDGPQQLSPSDTTIILQPGPTQTLWYNVNPNMAQNSTLVSIDVSGTDGCRTFNWIDGFLIQPPPVPFKLPNVQVQNCNFKRIPVAINPQTYALRMHFTASADSGWAVSPSDTSLQLLTNEVDTIWLTPTVPQLPIGSIVHIHATDTVSCTIYRWDTSFTVGVTPVPYSLKVTSDTVRINACDSQRIPVTLDVADCDSIAIDQMAITPAGGAFYFDSVGSRFLKRGRTDTIWFVYAPHGLNENTRYSISMKSHFVPEGQTYDTSFHFLGVSSGSPTPHLAAPSSLTMNSCSPTPLSVTFKAAGCEDIVVDSLQFSNVGIIVSGAPVNDTIRQGKSDTAHLLLNALYPGQRTFQIFSYLHRIGDQTTFDTLLIVNISVSGGASEPLIFSEPTLSLSNCDPSVVPFVLHAPCDSLTISSITFTNDQGITNFSGNLVPPFKMAAESSDTLLLTFPPQDLNLTATVHAEIKGSYGGTSTKFDTSAQSKVTFVCTDNVQDNPSNNSALSISGLTVNSGILRLGIHADNPIRCEAEILNTLGDIVASKTFQLSSNEDPVEWNISALPTGAYYLRLISGNYRTSTRFVIVR